MDNLSLTDLIEVELAHIHSREFSYTNVFKKSGERRRDRVNGVILTLLNHGYLVVKRPVFPDESRRSYLCVYSYTDPGIVSYLLGRTTLDDVRGASHRRSGTQPTYSLTKPSAVEKRTRLFQTLSS